MNVMSYAIIYYIDNHMVGTMTSQNFPPVYPRIGEEIVIHSMVGTVRNISHQISENRYTIEVRAEGIK